MTISKILIANRGEIACRIIDTARSMGIGTVAVYSDADAKHGLPLHAKLAGKRISIGGRDEMRGVEPYLIIERIIDVAIRSDADAIHPGYGFLSENPEFVEAVEKVGMTFIGPSAEAIRAMGLKDNAKALMEMAGVPVVPGYHGDAQDVVVLAGKASEIGYPVLIKARAGGGGKGMRLVERSEDFREALASAKREAASSFGDDRVLVEKFIESPRHIEVQVFGDSHGNVVHLFERDCSLQRRHQKVIEEAPAPGMSEEVREAMTSAAVKAAKAINYQNAGTIEFIVDGSGPLRPDGFWFMEMNTRLQVEHPITEAITGQDLVEWQIRVAGGERLPLEQDQLSINGHAFEARLYAEDVPKGFLPATGKLQIFQPTYDARTDSGVEEGNVISPFYDPMIAKVITHADDRATALENLHEALSDTRIAGTVTNISFLKELCVNTDFASGKVDTGLIERDLESLIVEYEPDDEAIVLAARTAFDLPVLEDGHTGMELGPNPFDNLPGFALWKPHKQTQRLFWNDEQFDVAFSMVDDAWQCALSRNGGPYGKPMSDPYHGEHEQAGYALDYDGGVAVFRPEATFEFAVYDPLDAASIENANPNAIIAPMPGLVKQVSVAKGDKVKEGQSLIVLEAMKMEHALSAPRDGIVAELNVVNGTQVEDGAILLALEEGK